MAVYFAHNSRTGLIKIGCSHCVEYRIGWIQRREPGQITIIGQMEGSFLDERAIHKRFAEHRAEGEWFYADREILSLAAENPPIPKLRPHCKRRYRIADARFIDALRAGA